MHCRLQGRTVRDFMRALKSAYAVGAEVLADDEPLAADAFDWSALARVSAPHFRVAHGVSCMLGPMDAAPKARQRLWCPQPHNSTCGRPNGMPGVMVLKGMWERCGVPEGVKVMHRSRGVQTCPFSSLEKPKHAARAPKQCT